VNKFTVIILLEAIIAQRKYNKLQNNLTQTIYYGTFNTILKLRTAAATGSWIT